MSGDGGAPGGETLERGAEASERGPASPGVDTAEGGPARRCALGRGRPKGTVVPVAELAERNGAVQIRVGLPPELSAALAERSEMPVACHLRCAILRALAASPRPSPPPDIAYGPSQQVRLPRELVEQVEAAYGVEAREAAIIAAVAAYVAT